MRGRRSWRWEDGDGKSQERKTPEKVMEGRGGKRGDRERVEVAEGKTVSVSVRERKTEANIEL